MIRPSARGQNLAARALAIVINDAFDRLGARRIFADIDPDNAASIRTFEKLGFQREGVLRAAWETHIGVRDSVIMGLTAFDPRPAILPIDNMARALRDGRPRG
jgi:RimJ/RimL family protein N-acetyltransferase